MRDDSVEWMTRLSELLGTERIDYGGYPSDIVAASSLFAPMEHTTYLFTQRVDREGLLGLVASRSHVATLEPRERDRVLASVNDLYEEIAGMDGATIPYVTHAFRALRRDDA